MSVLGVLAAIKVVQKDAQMFWPLIVNLQSCLHYLSWVSNVYVLINSAESECFYVRELASKTAKIIKRWYYSTAHWQLGDVIVSDITFLWFLLFSMCHLLHVAVNKYINWCFVHFFIIYNHYVIIFRKSKHVCHHQYWEWCA